MKEEEEEVWGRKRGRPKRKRKKRYGPTGGLRLSLTDREKHRKKERKKESRWYREQNEQVVQVKWEWEQERKKRRGDLREIKHGLCATEVRRQTSMLWRPAETSPADRLGCFPICSEEQHSPTWGRVKASRWDCLRQMKQGVFWCHLERTKAWFPVLPVTQRGLCSLQNSSRLFVVRALNNETNERGSYRGSRSTCQKQKNTVSLVFGMSLQTINITVLSSLSYMFSFGLNTANKVNILAHIRLALDIQFYLHLPDPWNNTIVTEIKVSSCVILLYILKGAEQPGRGFYKASLGK